MLIEILMALVFYKLFRHFLLNSGDGDDRLTDVDLSVTDSIFSVASRLERIYGGKAYVGLRIPDPEIGSLRHIDLVLASTRAVMVVAVRNLSGYIKLSEDGWVCTKDLKHRPETVPDPVPEVHNQVEILEAYLKQRGIVLPKGHVIGKVVLPNPNCRIALSIASQPEVVSFEEWMELTPASTKPQLSSWFKGAFSGEKGEMQDSLHQTIQFVLSTSPMWDRLELKGDKHMLGEFLEFKGTQEDMQALRNVKRSKVGRIIIQKASMFGLGMSRIPLLYAPRDYRSEGSSSTEWAEVAVKPTTEVLFQPFNAKKPKKMKITSIVSISLSA